MFNKIWVETNFFFFLREKKTPNKLKEIQKRLKAYISIYICFYSIKEDQIHTNTQYELLTQKEQEHKHIPRKKKKNQRLVWRLILLLLLLLGTFLDLLT